MENNLGGYWYTISDSGNPAVAADLSNTSKGSSHAAMATVDSSYISLTASLNKTLGDTWHQDAGWASLRMGFPGDGRVPDDISKIWGIRFQIAGPSIDSTVETILFKAYMEGVSDTAVHQVALPTSAIREEGGKTACIRPQDLKQLGNVSQAHRVAFLPNKLTRLAWEAKITDKNSPAIHAAKATFLLADLRFYISSPLIYRDPPFIGVKPKVETSRFSARYGNGVLHLSGTQGIQALEIRDKRGATLARFAPAARVDLDLPRGNYFLVAKRLHGLETKVIHSLR